MRFAKWTVAAFAICAAGIGIAQIATVNSRPTAFGALRTNQLGASARGVTLSDLNGDGYLDAVVSERSPSNTLRIFKGNGDGTFTQKAAIYIDGGINTSAVGDINGDGIPDIVGAGISGQLDVLIAYDAGFSFQTPTYTYTGKTAARFVALAQLAGAAQLSAFTTSYSAAATVQVLIGNGDGTFTLDAGIVTGTEPTGLYVGDINDDAVNDIVTANQTASPGTISVITGTGTNAFNAKVDYPVTPAGFPPLNANFLAVADLNGDLLPDIAYTTNTSNHSGFTCTMLASSVNATYFAPTCYSYNLHDTAPNGLAIGDLNGDGRPDIVTGIQSSNSTVAPAVLDVSAGLGILSNAGAGGFFPGLFFNTTIPPNIMSPSPYQVAIGDLNNDGVNDIVYVEEGNGTLPGYLGVKMGVPNVITQLGPGATLSVQGAGTTAAPVFITPLPPPYTPRAPIKFTLSSIGNVVEDAQLPAGSCFRVTCNNAAEILTGIDGGISPINIFLDGGVGNDVPAIPYVYDRCLSYSNATVNETDLAIMADATSTTCKVSILNPR